MMKKNVKSMQKKKSHIKKHRFLDLINLFTLFFIFIIISSTFHFPRDNYSISNSTLSPQKSENPNNCIIQLKNTIETNETNFKINQEINFTFDLYNCNNTVVFFFIDEIPVAFQEIKNPELNFIRINKSWTFYEAGPKSIRCALYNLSHPLDDLYLYTQITINIIIIEENLVWNLFLIFLSVIISSILVHGLWNLLKSKFTQKFNKSFFKSLKDPILFKVLEDKFFLSKKKHYSMQRFIQKRIKIVDQNIENFDPDSFFALIKTPKFKFKK